jgi:hypothetical protein
VICSSAAVVAIAGAQAVKKPGLWEITSNMTWIQSPFGEIPIAHGPESPGMSAPVPATDTSPFGKGTHKSQVCLTQEMIDKYGMPLPQSRDCHLENIVRTADSVTADWVCTGRMQGRGTIQSTQTEEGHAKGKMHFAGTMQLTSGPRPVEFVLDSTSEYKGADCGEVKPLPLPPEK